MTEGKEFDIMVVGELNVDLILGRLNKPPVFGEEQRADSMTLTLGSSTAIFSSNAAALGSRVAFCGKVGADSFGEQVMSSLKENGVNRDYVMVDPHLQTGATIIFEYEGEHMGVTYQGAMEHLSVSDVPEELFRKCRHLHTSAIFFQPGLKRDIVSLFQKAKEFGLTTSMDTQWDPDEKWDLDLNQLLPYLDFFVPNEQELIHLASASSLDEALESLSGFNTTFVVKRGAKGALMRTGGKTHTEPAWNVPEIADTVGAGDSFNAGFLHEFLRGKPLTECLRFGNLTAAVSTTKAGGTTGIDSYRQVTETAKQWRNETE
ncbi:MAG: carbohydrate kinase family protein [Balneolaceae bacterium]